MAKRKILSDAEEVVVAAIRILYDFDDYRIEGDFVICPGLKRKIRFRPREGFCLSIVEERRTA